jgi:hypothetical protein
MASINRLDEVPGRVRQVEEVITRIRIYSYNYVDCLYMGMTPGARATVNLHPPPLLPSP